MGVDRVEADLKLWCVKLRYFCCVTTPLTEKSENRTKNFLKVTNLTRSDSAFHTDLILKVHKKYKLFQKSIFRAYLVNKSTF